MISIQTGSPLTEEQQSAIDDHIAAVRKRRDDALVARFGRDITDEQAQAAGFRSRDHLARVSWCHPPQQGQEPTDSTEQGLC